MKSITTVDYTSMTIAQLEKHRAEIDSTIQDRKNEQFAQGVLADLAKHKITLETLNRLARKAKPAHAVATAPLPTNGHSKAPKVKASKGGKVAVKYRDPANPSNTWTARGMKPRWLTAAINAGAKLEDFRIGA